MNIQAFFSKLTHRIFVMEFVAEFVLIYPFYAIMVGPRGGVSAAGLGILLAVWQVTSVVAEVPTGIMADRLSRKWSMVIGKSLRILAFCMWLMFPNFWGYMAGFMALGAGDSFMSGAFQAYLYDSLTDAHKKGFNKIYSRSSSLTMLAYTLAYITSFVIGPQYNILLLASIAVSTLSLILCVSLPDTRADHEIQIKPRLLSQAVDVIRKKADVRQLLMGAVVISAMAMMLIEYIPVYYNQIGVSVRYVPLLLAFGNAVTVVLFWTMHRYEHMLVKYRAVVLAILGVFYVVSSMQNMIVAIVGILMFMRLTRLLVVNNESTLQHHLPGEVRATVSSIYAFVAKLGSAGIIMLVGALAIENRIVEPVRVIVVVMVIVYVLTQLATTKGQYSTSKALD